MSTIKNRLRAECKAKRGEYMTLPATVQKCATAFLNSSFYKESDVLLLYCSIGSEPDTTELIKEALEDNKTVFLPKVKGSYMNFFRIDSVDELSKGSFGITEPIEKNIYNDEKGCCIVPALGFDKNGNRLGYGKGYYDKFLSQHPNIIKIGFCAGCNFYDCLPAENFDIPVDYIFIDDKLFNVQGGLKNG